YELVAFDAYNRGQPRESDAALRKAAAGNPSAERRAAIDHNAAVLDAERNAAGARSLLSRYTDRVPEALVNLGILADREGDSRAAYDYWQQARNRGARGARLDEWIDSKKRLFGY